MAHFCRVPHAYTRVSLERSPSETSHAALLGREFPGLSVSLLSAAAAACWSCRLKPRYFTHHAHHGGGTITGPTGKEIACAVPVSVLCLLLIASKGSRVATVTWRQQNASMTLSFHQETGVRPPHTHTQVPMGSSTPVSARSPAAIGLSSSCKKPPAGVSDPGFGPGLAKRKINNRDELPSAGPAEQANQPYVDLNIIVQPPCLPVSPVSHQRKKKKEVTALVIITN